MSTPRQSFILPVLLLTALSACGSGTEPAQPPLSAVALKAVAAKPGVPRKALARAIDTLFADADAGETRAVLIMSGGRIVAERYGAGFTRDTRQLGWSMSASITGVLIGLLVSDGRLRLDQVAPVPAWQRSGDPRGGITVRQLLQMRSGLRHTGTGRSNARQDDTRMLYLDGRDNMAAYAEAQPMEAEPGRKWEYSANSSVILSDLAARALTDTADPQLRRQLVSEYLHTRLFEPLGMHSMAPEYDAAGTLIGSTMIHGTARDWGLFGEFLRNGGAVRGAQVLPRGWIEFMTSASPANPGFGAQLWLNHPQSDGAMRLLPGRVPGSAFAAIGEHGQYVLVSPDQGLTVVRLGAGEAAQSARVLDHLASIVKLFPRAD